MRDLGAAYDAEVETSGSEPLYRVVLVGWGGAPDPLDISSRVAGFSITRKLRTVADAVSLVVENSDGIFDVGGAWAGALAPNSATVEIDAGERIAGVESFYRVFTGGVIQTRQTDQVPGSPLKVTIGNRGRNLARIRMTSRRFGDPEADPVVPWAALDIIKDLFVENAGFTDPDDFNLPALVFPTTGVQFEGESLLGAANTCLQPSARQLYFEYDGRLSHRALLPLDWHPDLTLVPGVAASIKSEQRPPDATRILVTGGPRTMNRPAIGEAEVWATGGYTFQTAPWTIGVRGAVPTRWGVDTKGYPEGWYSLTGYVAWICLAGVQGQQYRLRYSFVPHRGYSTSGAGPDVDMTASPDDHLNIRVDCSAVTEATFAWAGCNTGDKIAVELQRGIRELGGYFSEVTVQYLFDNEATWHYFVKGPPGRPETAVVIITPAAGNSCTDELLLGVADGGTEGTAADVRWTNDSMLAAAGELTLVQVNWENLPPLTCSEEWNPDAERQEIEIYIQVTDRPAVDETVDFDFDVMGYALADLTPSVDAQAWDDTLIGAYGEIKKSVAAVLALTYEQADAVAQMELVFAQKSVQTISIALPRVDLRIEPGDVVRIPYRGSTIAVWVQGTAIVYDNSPKASLALQGVIV